ncbi:unnamed protein product [Amoebophrya sp. A25]|nr:unnamed protein product [Amoebophrya sp. A25]|eukprot:GSA25T00025972001.1
MTSTSLPMRKLVRTGGLVATGAIIFGPLGVGALERKSKEVEQRQEIERIVDTNGVTAFDDDDLDDEVEDPSSALWTMARSGMGDFFWDGFGSAYKQFSSATSWNSAGTGDNNFISSKDQDDTSSHKKLESSVSTLQTANAVLTENNYTTPSSSALELIPLKRIRNFAEGLTGVDALTGFLRSDEVASLVELKLADTTGDINPLRQKFIRDVIFGGNELSKKSWDGIDDEAPITKYRINMAKLDQLYYDNDKGQGDGQHSTRRDAATFVAGPGAVEVKDVIKVGKSKIHEDIEKRIFQGVAKTQIQTTKSQLMVRPMWTRRSFQKEMWLMFTRRERGMDYHYFAPVQQQQQVVTKNSNEPSGEEKDLLLKNPADKTPVNRDVLDKVVKGMDKKLAQRQEALFCSLVLNGAVELSTTRYEKAWTWPTAATAEPQHVLPHHVSGKA